MLDIFEKKHQLEIPLFQRQYVWDREQQWEPLWEDISRKFVDYIAGRKDGPVHFLGAMVLDQKQTSTSHLYSRQVIDGQQRLTTFQIFLAAFRDFCLENECVELAGECEEYLLNSGRLANPENDRYKIRPTQADRAQFADVVTACSSVALLEKYPLRYRSPWARKAEPRPRMVEAYFYFHRALTEFFDAPSEELTEFQDYELSSRLEDCFAALRSALQVVVIDLAKDDDAQVIFETLNARGEPLLPADLLRNFIFLRAARANEDQEALYEEYWRPFDDDFWRVEIRQGRLSRPRSDLFMQHFLASQRTADIPVKHLYTEYKFWIERFRPFPTVRDELAAIARQRDSFRRIIEPEPTDPLLSLFVFLERFDVSTAYPLLLHLLDSGLSVGEWREISAMLESYLLRRAICDLTTKGYNRIFLGLTRSLRREGTSVTAIRSFLTSLGGESQEWPNDERFAQGWRGQSYRSMQSGKLEFILRKISDSYLGSLTEHISVHTPLTLEHIMPQSWIEHWRLGDGSRGLSYDELLAAEEDDVRAVATARRDARVQSLGNLTLVTQPLNSSVSNGPWAEKKPSILAASLLPLNQQLYTVECWNDEAIERRSTELLDRAKQIWIAPPTTNGSTDRSDNSAMRVF